MVPTASQKRGSLIYSLSVSYHLITMRLCHSINVNSPVQLVSQLPPIDYIIILIDTRLQTHWERRLSPLTTKASLHLFFPSFLVAGFSNLLWNFPLVESYESQNKQM